jgi:uncharacterized membrane protein YbhN (UPF0104 family)
MTLSRSRIALCGGAAATLLVLVVTPQLLGGRVSGALVALRGADPGWLTLGAVGFIGGFCCTVGAWRSALSAAGGSICAKQASARLGIGSLVNAFAPAKLGDAVKIALCARAVEGPDRLWTTGGVYAALAAARSLCLAALLVVASATGALPLWPVFVLCSLVAVIGCAAAFSGRLRNHPRIAHLLGALAALERSPRAVASLLGWTAAMVLMRLSATVAVAAAIQLPHPFLAALLILPALDVAAAFPVTPGGMGVGSGAVAVALAGRGIGASQALGVGIAIQALETAVAIGAGSAGALYLAGPGTAARRWSMRVAFVGAAASAAALLGVAVLDVL